MMDDIRSALSKEQQDGDGKVGDGEELRGPQRLH